MNVADHANNILLEDGIGLLAAERSYGSSWKKRGGVGAFMMLARKFDRIETLVSQGHADRGIEPWDIFRFAQDDSRPEGIIDDIRDLRRYLTLVGAEVERLHIGGVEGSHLLLLPVLAARDLEQVCLWEKGSVHDSTGVEAGRVLQELWGQLEQQCRLPGGGWRSVFDVIPNYITNVRLCLLGIEGTLRRDGILHGAHRDNS